MGRPLRAAVGGLVYHVLNRANARLRIFDGDADYAAFERVLAEAVAREGTRLLGYCLMPNHWHLVVWPRRDGELSRFAGWVALTHTQRRHARRRSAGGGHLYQGRFKSFPVEGDGHYLTVLRYVERNALRARLATRAERWRWGSLWLRAGGVPRPEGGPPLSDGPVPLPDDWPALVNAPPTGAEEDAVAVSLTRGRPFGGPAWQQRTAARLGLEATFRPRGRPRKHPISGIGS
jgi:putative transposase